VPNRQATPLNQGPGLHPSDEPLLMSNLSDPSSRPPASTVNPPIEKFPQACRAGHVHEVQLYCMTRIVFRLGSTGSVTARNRTRQTLTHAKAAEQASRSDEAADPAAGGEPIGVARAGPGWTEGITSRPGTPQHSRRENGFFASRRGESQLAGNLG